ncbi:hypothetical protein V6N12_030973 [Hibiscus sabdariffa]|uniref:Uncharacterized protein n=1 Tax=Hibiscus sabdariffa TaxID=183260 RepID=A0ABR2E7M4_9ROSI
MVSAKLDLISGSHSLSQARLSQSQSLVHNSRNNRMKMHITSPSKERLISQASEGFAKSRGLQDYISRVTRLNEPHCHYLVNMAKREPRNQFWRRKRGVSNPGDGFHKANVGDVPRTEPHTIRSVESLEMKDHLLVL